MDGPIVLLLLQLELGYRDSQAVAAIFVLFVFGGLFLTALDGLLNLIERWREKPEEPEPTLEEEDN